MEVQDRDGLRVHLKSGLTTTCHAWAIARRDGQLFGFTDHDCRLSFEGQNFVADGGMTARSIARGNGLAVDNSETLGVLRHDAIRAEDIRAGRYDGAMVTVWQVNWASPSQRKVVFKGSIGEIREQDGSFEAELRGLTEALGQPQGRVYQGPCAAILGDVACSVDLSVPGYVAEAVVLTPSDGRVFELPSLSDFAEGWFDRGTLEVLDGGAMGLRGVVRTDVTGAVKRTLSLWDGLRLEVAEGTRVRLTSGCDKRAVTCRAKFNNFVNFQGFPHIPGDDWAISYPTRAGLNDGGRRV